MSLAGVRVLDLSQVISGPWATSFLADQVRVCMSHMEATRRRHRKEDPPPFRLRRHSCLETSCRHAASPLHLERYIISHPYNDALPPLVAGGGSPRRPGVVLFTLWIDLCHTRYTHSRTLTV